MNRSIKNELVLEGLNCANCAARIEKLVGEIEGVNYSTMNFITKTLTIETESSDRVDEIISKTRGIVSKLEPHVVVREKESKRHQHNHSDEASKGETIRLAAGAVLFGIALVFKFDFPVKLAVYLISYLLVGGEVLVRALQNIIKGQVFDENFLMTIATIGAFAIGEFPEGVAVMLFYQVGEMFQDMAVNRSRKSIADLMDIRPDYANLKSGSEIKKVSPEAVNIGELIVVKPGEKFPLDGKVIEGKSLVDTSALTGEPVPREVKEGSEVLGGFINKNGVLTVKVTKEFGESTVAKILELVQNAGGRKAPTENFITKFARYYTPAVVFTALAIAVIPSIIFQGGWSQWVYRALIFLVISCPCALVVSIPLGFFGGIGGASRNGILVKGGNFLEALNNVDTVVFDKTGTLTKGVFKVADINPTGNITKEELLKYAAFAESYSNHPIASSILDAYGKEINREEIEHYEEITGQGIKAYILGKEILAGNGRLMDGENISCNNVDAIGTVVHIALDKEYAGYIIIADEIKQDSKRMVEALKDMGIKKTVMLTGDSESIAKKVSSELGIKEAYYELLPHEKVEKLEMLDRQKSQGGKLVFIGDGINDAPVLARADIGVAMGGLGSDAAIEASDVVIMTDEPYKLVTAIKIAKRTRKIVWQNIVFALGVKCLVLLLGAGGAATMWEAVFADVGVALIAIMNSMRAMRV